MGLLRTCLNRNLSILGYYLIFIIFMNELKKSSKLGIIFVYNFIYSRNRTYNVHICFYSNNLLKFLFYSFYKNKTSGNFYKTINRSYYFLKTNLALVASYTRITTLTNLDRRLIIRFRLMLELFQ
jgi:hypothetical protein